MVCSVYWVYNKYPRMQTTSKRKNNPPGENMLLSDPILALNPAISSDAVRIAAAAAARGSMALAMGLLALLAFIFFGFKTQHKCANTNINVR